MSQDPSGDNATPSFSGQSQNRSNNHTQDHNHPHRQGYNKATLAEDSLSAATEQATASIGQWSGQATGQQDAEQKQQNPAQMIHKGGLQVVIGLGQSGLSAARYLTEQGYKVAVTDANAAPTLATQLPNSITIRQFGQIDGQLLRQAARIIISPGIALTTPEIAAVHQAGTPVISDIQLFRDACTVPIVAITGSNAKTTVTTLVGQMAKDAGVNVGVGGNIGLPALTLLDNPDMTLAVLELSSFQLETVTNLGAQVACVLNMSPDHLDRHGDMLGYHQAKHRIFQGAKSVVVNREDALTRPLVADDLPRISVGSNAPDKGQYGLITEANGSVYLARGAEVLLAANSLRIKGQHNLVNALSALAIGELAGLPIASMVETLKNFGGLEHRCQYVAEIAGIDYFNDSKGTNVGSTQAAILGLGSVYSSNSHGKTKLILILGGQGKGQNFGELVPLVNKYVSQVLLIGEAAKLISEHLQQANLSDEVDMYHYQTLDQAMDKAQSLLGSSLSQVGAVLLSPACASLDQYSSYNERGEHFCQLVDALKS